MLPDATSNLVYTFIGEYNGDESHKVRLQLFNYDTTTFDYITSDDTDLPTALEQETYQFNLPSPISDYIKNGELEIRILHETKGNNGHLLRIDRMYLEAGSSSSSSSSASSSSSSSSSTSSSSTSFSSSSSSIKFES